MRLACTSTLLTLAVSLLSTCRQPEPVEAVVSFLHGVGQATRNPSVVANATDAPALKAQVRSSMARHVGGETGAALLGGIVNGLADTFPPRTCAAAADVLAPLLHCESWHEHAPAWAHASLAALPSTDGVPPPMARQHLLQELQATPDPYAQGMDLQAMERLRDALLEFARVCRRMADVVELERERYG